MTIHDGCDTPHRRSTCSVIGIPFPVSICTYRDEVCSDMNAFAEHLFRPLFWVFGGSVVIHEDACPPTRVERLLQ